MAALPRLRTLLSFHRCVAAQNSLWPRDARPRSAFLSSRASSDPPATNAVAITDKLPNESLLEKLNIMGVDVKRACKRQPGVLRKNLTNEEGVSQFLQGKGASCEAIASIISRYPRTITRSVRHLERRWHLWSGIFTSDVEILSILERSPESFFRTSDNDNLEKNINFLISLGLKAKHLHRMLTTAPRTFSNSLNLNRQMVDFLECVCQELGGENPQQFVKAVISRNVYILIQSVKRVRENIDYLQTSLKLCDTEMLTLLLGQGAEILDLSSEYLQNNFRNIQQKLVSHGCGETDIKQLIMNHPVVLYNGSSTLNSKLDCLVKGGIAIHQVIQKPRVLDLSTVNITGRLEELKRLDYDFQKNDIGILYLSRKRFEAKLEKLCLLEPK